MKALLVACVAVLAAVDVVAQEPPSRLTLAPDTGSWVIELSTSGGFTGRGRGASAMRSDGTAICTQPVTCGSTIAIDVTRTIDALIARLQTPAWRTPATEDSCRDCYTTTLTVRLRLADGSERRSVFTWTDITFTRLPDDVRQVYKAAMRATQATR